MEEIKLFAYASNQINMSEINSKAIFEAIDQISSQNPISKEETIEIIKNAVYKAFNSKYDPDAELELLIDEDKGIFELFNNSKLVVSDEEYIENGEYSAIEIPLKQAKEIKKTIKVGEFIRAKVNFALYSRMVAQQIRQVFTQNIREKKKEAIYATHKGLKGEMIGVIVSSITPSFVIFQLEDGTSAFMPSHFRNPNIKLAVGQNAKVYVEDVLEDSKDAQIIVSNGSKQLVKRVLEEEVPEVSDGIIEIVSISRQPGVRSKVAVKSNNADIDPVGTIIGQRGSRINAINAKLEGEKLDIVLHSDDINVFIANALSPAKIASVIDKRDNDDNIIEKQKIAIAPNNQLTLAIGKGGINAKLAVELTNHRIDVISMEQATEKEIIFELNVGLTQEKIDLIEKGIRLENKNSNITPRSQINNNEFDNSIANFNESILEDNTSEEKFDIDDNLFSDEQLKEMEAAFEFDSEIKGADIKDEDTKF